MVTESPGTETNNFKPARKRKQICFICNLDSNLWSSVNQSKQVRKPLYKWAKRTRCCAHTLSVMHMPLRDLIEWHSCSNDKQI